MDNTLPAYDQTTPVQSGTSTATLPAYEETQPASKEDYSVGGFVGNAVKDLGRNLSGMAQSVYQGAYAMPKALLKTPVQMAQGTPFAQTEMGQQMSAGANQAGQMTKDIQGVAADPVGAAYRNPVTAASMLYGGYKGARSMLSDAGESGQMAFGKVPEPPSATELPVMQPGAKVGDPHALFSHTDDFGSGGAQRNVYKVYGDPQHPDIQKTGWGSDIPEEQLGNIPVTGRTPVSLKYQPTAGAEAGAPPPQQTQSQQSQPQQEPNYLERSGGAGLNATAGIRGSTIQKLTPRGQNPGTVGINLSKELNDAGAIGTSGIDTWGKMYGLKEQAGQDVASALQAIRDRSAQSSGAGDPLMIDADKALKPLLDEWTKRAGGITPAAQATARPLEELHEGLSNLAKNQGGQLHLDNIRQAMDEIGPLTHKGDLEKQALYSDQYHNLAEINDHMVDTIAKGANNPTLASNLKNANKKYSMYMRVMPDVSRVSAMESVGQKSFSGMIGDLKNSLVSKTALSAGKLQPILGQAAQAAPAAPILSKAMPEQP